MIIFYYQGRPVAVKALPGRDYVEDAVNAGYWTRTNTGDMAIARLLNQVKE